MRRPKGAHTLADPHVSIIGTNGKRGWSKALKETEGAK
jgi:hypothetical protein